jgi:F-type H+-transporting ATPase subunit b
LIYNFAIFMTADAQRIFGLDMQTFFDVALQLFNACLLAAVLGFVLYKPVQKFLRARSDKISGQLNEARDGMAQANKIKAEYEKKFINIDTERIRILEAARLEAADQGRHIIEDAKREANDIRRRAHEGAMAERERLKEETRLHILEVSSLMAGKFVAQNIDSATQDRLFDETMAQLEETKWLS